jgi:hypothetical protein
MRKKSSDCRRRPTINPTGPGLRYICAMVEKPAAASPALHNWTESLTAALKAAEADLRSGDAAEAEKRAKAVSAFAKAARELTELQAAIAAHTPEEDVELIRELGREREALWSCLRSANFLDAPAHLRAARVSGGDMRITWMRRARIGDHGGVGEPPIGAAA